MKNVSRQSTHVKNFSNNSGDLESEEFSNDIDNKYENNKNSDYSSSGDKEDINIFHDTTSQTSVKTKSSGSSIWNLNKDMGKDHQNSFSSNKFLKLQIIL